MPNVATPRNSSQRLHVQDRQTNMTTADSTLFQSKTRNRNANAESSWLGVNNSPFQKSTVVALIAADVYQPSAASFALMDLLFSALSAFQSTIATNQRREESPCYAKIPLKPTKDGFFSPMNQNGQRTVLVSALVLEPLKLEMHPNLCLKVNVGSEILKEKQDIKHESPQKGF